MENDCEYTIYLAISRRSKFIKNDLLPKWSDIHFCKECNKIIVSTDDCFSRGCCLICGFKRNDICPDGVFESVLLYVKESSYENKKFFDFHIKDGEIIDITSEKSFIHCSYNEHRRNRPNGIHTLSEDLSKLNFYPIRRKEN